MNSSPLNNKIWNLLVILIACQFLHVSFILASHRQDLFHSLFNYTTFLALIINAVGVYGYANNIAVLRRTFWASYFFVYCIFSIFFNAHCFQHHAPLDVSRFLNSYLINISLTTVLPIYALYRYAFVKNSF
jgi:hypothetical protein